MIAAFYLELGVTDLSDDAGTIQQRLILDIAVGDITVTLVTELPPLGIANNEETGFIVVATDNHRMITGLLTLDLLLVRNPDKSSTRMEGIENL